ncbi:MAG: MBL fold metallo-hydrolase [Polyangiaceae bacterium]|nr:MBL fold metallo-hydrolase [Myxococcales bacterium]MCB9588014.1 MBL fold metallo-hydrolase [Polyangiaceae bacterium]
MQIQSFYDKPTFTLTFVVWDEQTNDAVVIDPVLDFNPLTVATETMSASHVLEFIQKRKLNVHYILETHAHADHLSGAQFLKRHLNAKVVIGEKITKVQSMFKDIFALGELKTDGSQFDKLAADDEVIKAGSLEVKVIATPGHTPACVSYLIDDAVFTGDALFIEDYGTGRCDFPGGNAADLYDSVHGKLYNLPEETRVFVGHDYQPGGRPLRCETTIADSKAKNPQLKQSTEREAFVEARQARDATLDPPRLLYPSVQINIAAGQLPPENPNGRRYLSIPLNLRRPTDEAGEPKAM